MGALRNSPRPSPWDQAAIIRNLLLAPQGRQEIAQGVSPGVKINHTKPTSPAGASGNSPRPSPWDQAAIIRNLLLAPQGRQEIAQGVSPGVKINHTKPTSPAGAKDPQTAGEQVESHTGRAKEFTPKCIARRTGHYVSARTPPIPPGTKRGGGAALGSECNGRPRAGWIGSR